MTKPDTLKSGASETRAEHSVITRYMSALWAFICVADPERKRWRKSDIAYAKYHARNIASILATRGPKALDEPTSTLVEPADDVAQQPDSTTESASAKEWRYASRCVSQLSTKLVELMVTMDNDDPLFPDLFEALGILTYTRATVAKMLANGK